MARIRQAADALGPGARTGRDGRQRPVDPTAGRAAIAKALAEEPASSLRQAAEAAGVAPSTVHRTVTAVRRLRAGPPERVGSSSPELPLEDMGDLHPNDVPLGRIYEVADELRRKARTCLELADALERRARACRQVRSGSEPSGLDGDHAFEPITEAREAGRGG